MTTIRLACSSALLMAGFIGEAAAQQQGTLNLFRAARVAPPRGVAGSPAEAFGMRPAAVGQTGYFALSAEAGNRLRAGSSAPQRMRIALPGGNSVVCAFNSELSSAGQVVMQGAPAGGAFGSRCDLVVQNGQVVGDIDLGGQRYRILPLEAGDVHAVVRVRTEAFPNESAPLAATGQKAGTGVAPTGPVCDVRPAQGQKPKSFGPVRILVAYTPAAKVGVANMQAEIALLIGQLRTVWGLERTGGNFSITPELAHAVEVNYKESDSPSMEKDVERLKDPNDPFFKTIHALRDTHKADLVALLIKSRDNDGCGIAWTPNLPLDHTDEKWAFAVIDRECANSNYSFAHELGHNFGMNHDRFVVPDNKPGPGEYNFGLILMQQNVRTTMAYNDECKKAGKNCTRMLAFSTPNLAYKGIPIGRPISNRAAAHNTEVLCQGAEAVSNFR